MWITVMAANEWSEDAPNIPQKRSSISTPLLASSNMRMDSFTKVMSKERGDHLSSKMATKNSGIVVSTWLASHVEVEAQNSRKRETQVCLMNHKVLEPGAFLSAINPPVQVPIIRSPTPHQASRREPGQDADCSRRST